ANSPPHSFPTRRSSDLPKRALGERLRLAEGKGNTPHKVKVVKESGPGITRSRGDPPKTSPPAARPSRAAGGLVFGGSPLDRVMPGPDSLTTFTLCGVLPFPSARRSRSPSARFGRSEERRVGKECGGELA